MQTNPQPTPEGPKAPTRQQKYFGFVLQPGDEALLPLLSEEHRAILKGHGSYAERAEALGVAVGTVRSRLHRARAALEKLRAAHNLPEDKSPVIFLS
jgi:DNA-directed RNA polymerase specialized sigma24 family protein